MADFDNENEGGSNLVAWSPAIVGAGVSAYRVNRSFRRGEVRPSRWMAPAGSDTNYARDMALEQGRTRVSSTISTVDDAREVSRIGEIGAWRSIPNSNTAIASAARASLLRGNQMNMGDIDLVTKTLLEKTTLNVFELAHRKVVEQGDISVFRSTLNRFIKGGQTPGEFLPNEVIDEMYKRPYAPTYTSVYNYRGGNLGSTEKWISQMNKAGLKTELAGVVSYPGGVNMAHVRVHWGPKLKSNMYLPTQRAVFGKVGSTYITPRVFAGIPSRGGQLMDFGDYYVKQITEKLAPKIRELTFGKKLSTTAARRLITGAVSEFDEEMDKLMVWSPGMKHPSVSPLNRVNANLINAPELSSTALRANKGINVDEEMGLLYRKYGAFPAVSGAEIMAGRIYGGVDPRKLWAYGSEYPFERRPLQFLKEYTPTPSAMEYMSDPRNAIPAFGSTRPWSRAVPFLLTKERQKLMEQGVISPQLAIGYAVPGGELENQLMKRGLAAEEMLIHGDRMRMFDSQRIKTVSLSLEDMIGTDSRIANWIKANAGNAPDTISPLKLNPGEFVGYEMRTGRELMAASANNVEQQLIGISLATGEGGQKYARLSIQESHFGNSGVKLFGSDKVTTRARDRGYMRKLASSLGSPGLAEDLDAFLLADGLRKNRSILRQQMASGLAILTSRRLGSRTAVSEAHRLEMTRFLGMGAEEIEAWLPDELAILRKTKEWGLSTSLVGGAIPHAKDILPVNVIEEAERIAGPGGLVNKRGMIVGTGMFNVGAYRHTSGGGIFEAGARASMEPRGFSNLLQHKWMVGDRNVSKMLAADLAASMESFGPEINEFSKILSGMNKGLQIPNLESPWDVTGKFRLVKPGAQGKYINLGAPLEAFGGASHIYIPPEGTMAKLGYFRSSSGKILPGDLMSAYEKVQRAAAANAFRGGERLTSAVTEELATAAEELARAILEEGGSFLYGRGGSKKAKGAIRGKVMGSRMLAMSAIDPMYGGKIEKHLIEVSEKAGLEMLEDLEKTATSTESLDFIKRQRERFLSGQSVEGTVSRHPYIGPYSIQPTRIYRSKDPSSQTEWFVKTPARIEETVMAGSLGELKVNLSPILGMAADYDDDRLAVKMIGEVKTAKAVSDLLDSGKFTHEYKKFAAQATVMTKLAKRQLGDAAAPAVDDVQRIMIGGAKLRIGSAETARISEAMTEAKLAMASHRPDKAPLFNIFAEVMEQQIISGKKMKDIVSQNMSEKVTSAMRNINREQDFNELVKIVEDMFGPDLEKGVEITQGGQALTELKMSPREMVEDLKGAMQAGNQEGGVLTQYRKFARGRFGKDVSIAVGEMTRFLDEARSGNLNDALANLAARGAIKRSRGPVARQMSRVLSGMNRALTEIGARATTWLRPAFWGLTATAGIVMARGAIRGQELTPPIPPARGDVLQAAAGARAMSQAVLQALPSSNRDLRPESMPIPASTVGAPTPPGMATPSMYLGSNGSTLGYKMRIRARSGHAPDQGSISQALQPVVGRARMSITYNDNRAKLTSQQMAEMMERP